MDEETYQEERKKRKLKHHKTDECASCLDDRGDLAQTDVKEYALLSKVGFYSVRNVIWRLAQKVVQKRISKPTI